MPVVDVLPVRVTVKVKAVEPLLPSAVDAPKAAIAKAVSSFRMVPVALAVPSVAVPDGAERVRANVSSDSTVVSPAT